MFALAMLVIVKKKKKIIIYLERSMYYMFFRFKVDLKSSSESFLIFFTLVIGIFNDRFSDES